MQIEEENTKMGKERIKGRKRIQRWSCGQEYDRERTRMGKRRWRWK